MVPDQHCVALRNRQDLSVVPRLPASADRHPGVNGWLSSWGGELAGCPPGPRAA